MGLGGVFLLTFFWFLGVFILGFFYFCIWESGLNILRGIGGGRWRSGLIMRLCGAGS